MIIKHSVSTDVKVVKEAEVPEWASVTKSVKEVISETPESLAEDAKAKAKSPAVPAQEG